MSVESVTTNRSLPESPPVSGNETANESAPEDASVSGNETANRWPAPTPPVIRNAFATLAGFALSQQGVEVSCSTCGRTTRWRHCVTCHQEPEFWVSPHDGKAYLKNADHGSCYGCGACLPSGVRRRYCSSTCRVRVHNYYRHTADGQARAAANRAALEEWMASFTAEFAGQIDPRERLRRSASFDGKGCGRCGTEFGPDQPVYLGRWGSHRTLIPICATCAEPDKLDYHGRPIWCNPLPCGGCGRQVHEHRSVPGRYRHFVRWTACCQRCYGKAQHRWAKERDAERDPIDCLVCGERVDARRRDARYCSPKCRQKAYRSRCARESVTSVTSVTPEPGRWA